MRIAIFVMRRVWSQSKVFTVCHNAIQLGRAQPITRLASLTAILIEACSVAARWIPVLLFLCYTRTNQPASTLLNSRPKPPPHAHSARGRQDIADGPLPRSPYQREPHTPTNEHDRVSDTRHRRPSAECRRASAFLAGRDEKVI